MAVIFNSNTDAIWNYLQGRVSNDYGVAGLMGNLFAESGCDPENVEDGYGWTDAAYTAAVNAGTESFTRTYDKGGGNYSPLGYGIAQWTSAGRKQALYDLKLQQGVSIGDLSLQLDYLWIELNTSYSNVLAAMTSAGNVRQASDYVLVHFENPADQSEAVKILRASYGQEYYDHYHGSTPFFNLYRYGGIREMLRRLVIHA